MFTVNDVVEVSVVCGNVAFWRTVSYGSERDFIVVHFPCRYGQRAEAEKQLVPAQTGKSNLIDNLARYRHHFPVVTAYFFFLPSLLLFHWRYSTPVQRPASIDLPAPIAGVSRFKMKLHNSMKMQHVTLLIYVIAQTERERENTALIRKSEARIFWGIFRFSFSEFDCSIHTSI